MYELAAPLADQLHTTFFMKDLYDEGLAAARNTHFQASPRDSLSIVNGYTLLDEAFDADGKPNRDYHLWTGLVRLLISAGDICHAAVKVRVSRDESDPVIRQWSFYYEMNQLEYLFLTVYRTDQTAEESKPSFEHKALGSIDKKSYMAKLGAYPLLVNPALARRSTAALNFIAAHYLTEAGLHLDASWHPEDTSKHFARYHLTDGVDHYIIDYAAPVLLNALAFIDHLSGRTEEDGGIVLDDENPILKDYEIPDAAIQTKAALVVDELASADFKTHHNLPHQLPQ